jgi:NADPH2:quinone reductase
VKVWHLSRYGEPEDARERADVPRPAPVPGQLMVQVLAAASSFPDVFLCRGPAWTGVASPGSAGG